MTAIATSEVYFERPEDFSLNQSAAGGAGIREVGSLFNPYWQVRLITNVSPFSAL